MVFGHLCRFGFSSMKYLYFNFQACALKKKNFESGVQCVGLDSLYNAGTSAWQGEQPFKFNKL